MENNVQEDYKSEILGIVRSNASPGIMRDKLEDYHENDLAEVFPELTITERRKVYRILDIGMLSDIFEHIDEKQAAAYLDEMDIKKAAAILSGMETDAVVDVLRMTSKEKRPVLIDLMDAEARKDMAVIASFDDEEIGSRMTTNCIVIRENLTVKQPSGLIDQAAKNEQLPQLCGDRGWYFLWSHRSEGSHHRPAGIPSGRSDRDLLPVRLRPGADR